MASRLRLPGSIVTPLGLAFGVIAGCALPESVGVESMSAQPTAPVEQQPASLLTARAEASPMPTSPREPASLAHVAFGTDRPDVNMKMLGRSSGANALDGLLPADGRGPTVAMLVEGRRYEFVGPLDSGNPQATRAHFVTYALRFANSGDAAAAYLEIVTSLEGVDLWRPRQMAANLELGDESAAFRRVGPEGRESVAHVWRRTGVILAILGLTDSDEAAVYDTARRMDERAR